MELKLIDAGTVRRLLPMKACVSLMEQGFVALFDGETGTPRRQAD